MKSFFLAMGVFFLASCASKTTVQNVNQTTTKEINVVATMSRFLNLEQCGCSFNPQGGLEWEWNKWTEWKKEGIKNPVFVSGGHTFLFLDPHGPKLTDKEQFTKASFLMEGLNQLDLKALGLTAVDYGFGVSRLEKLKAKANFPFVATNMKDNGKKLTVPYALVEKDGIPVAVFSLSTKPAKKLPKGVTWENPVEAFKRAKAMLPAGKKPLIVVLSDLTWEERTDLLATDKDINIMIGEQSTKNFSFAFIPLRKQTVFANPEYFGRAYARAQIKLNDSFDGFWIPDDEQVSVEERTRLSKFMGNMDREISNAQSELERKELEIKKADLQEQWLATEFLDNKNNPNAGVLTSSITSINKELDTGKNPMTQLVEKYHAEISSDKHH